MKFKTRFILIIYVLLSLGLGYIPASALIIPGWKYIFRNAPQHLGKVDGALSNRQIRKLASMIEDTGD